MLAKTFSAAIVGVDAHIVEVEVNATGEGNEITVAIVGLPDAAVREAKDRVRSALHSCGYLHPHEQSMFYSIGHRELWMPKSFHQSYLSSFKHNIEV